MTISLLIEGKVLGKKQPLFSDWRIDLPPLREQDGDHRKLRDLITSIVIEEVKGFELRQEKRKLTQVLSTQEINQGVASGKIDSGGRDLIQNIEIEGAVSEALQAFEDGLYFVFIDDVQYTNLDSEIYLQKDNKLVFLRLVAMVGG
ncbi:MAG: hypothetical protein C0410_04545 [Anaerolinea sp.]|nr:hypothetical protein [Anaerolinea sp.]